MCSAGRVPTVSALGVGQGPDPVGSLAPPAHGEAGAASKWRAGSGRGICIDWKGSGQRLILYHRHPQEGRRCRNS